MTTLRLQRLRWTWWLAVLALLALCGQVFELSLGMKPVRAAELEGFENEWEEEDEPAPAVVAPKPHIQQGYQASRGSIQGSDEEGDEDGGEDPPEAAVKAAGVKRRQDEWDEDEFEDVEALQNAPPAAKPSGQQKGTPKKQNVAPLGASSGPKRYYYEALGVALLLGYLANYYLGGKRNEKFARTFAIEFAEPGKIFHKNFSLLGVGTATEGDRALMIKEGQATFKFYASGRRFCHSLLGTMQLRARQDLVMSTVSAVQPAADRIRFEVYMNDEDMEPFIFALARKRTAKLMLKNEKDLKDFAALVDAPRPKRLSDELTIVAESKELISELLPEVVLDQVLGDKAFATHGRYFVSMHFTDNAPPPWKKALSFVFNLPPPDKMEDLTRLVAMIPFYIDLIGRLRLTPQQRAKAEERRSKTVEEDLKEKMRRQAELLAKKKAEKKAAEDEALAGLSREQQRREEEKRRKKEIAKMMPKAKISRR